jgi:hypothetical protein
MSDNEQIIVLVSDKADSGHGEITVVEDFAKAERLMEALLEAGFEQDRIHVFRGTRSEFSISHKPVVSFGEEEAQGQAAPRLEPKAAPARLVKAEEAKPEAADSEVPVQEGQLEAVEVKAKGEAAEQSSPSDERAPEAGGEGDGPGEEGAEAETETATAGPVRFSSLFRSA